MDAEREVVMDGAAADLLAVSARGNIQEIPSDTANRVKRIRIDPDTVPLVTGPGGKNIRLIHEKTGADVTVDRTGVVSITAGDAEAIETAQQMVQAVTERRRIREPLRKAGSGSAKASIQLLTVVGGGARMEGTFEITNSIEIQCEVSGELYVGAMLIVGERGVLKANVQTADALIKGRYEGDMIATGNVEIGETGRVTGTVQTDSLVIAKGGFFNGTVTKTSHSPRLVTREGEQQPTPRLASDGSLLA